MAVVALDSMLAAYYESLPNVRFEFKLVGGSYRQEFTTDINGEIDLSKLTPGAYEVRELEAPDGYLIDDAVRVVQVNPDENANFVFTNTPKPSLRLIKTSSDGTRLGGVHFRIARIEDGTHYLDRITDQDGEINIANLEPGVYSIKETATVADHILDLQEYHVELFPGQTSTITIENQKRPNLIVYKKDADTGDPIPNTVFTVRAADGHSVDEIKTDSEGKATLAVRSSAACTPIESDTTTRAINAQIRRRIKTPPSAPNNRITEILLYKCRRRANPHIIFRIIFILSNLTKKHSRLCSKCLFY